MDGRDERALRPFLLFDLGGVLIENAGFERLNALLPAPVDLRIGCLTNSNALHWARFSGFEDSFDVRLSSHLTGVIKPDRRCFEHAIAACGVPADRIHFFDDAKPNVIGAREAGMRAWHVEGFDELRAALA